MPGPCWLTEQEQWIGQGLLDVMTKCCKHSTLGTHSAPEWSTRAAINRKSRKTCAIKTQAKVRNAPWRGALSAWSMSLWHKRAGLSYILSICELDPVDPVDYSGRVSVLLKISLHAQSLQSSINQTATGCWPIAVSRDCRECPDLFLCLNY